MNLKFLRVAYVYNLRQPGSLKRDAQMVVEGLVGRLVVSSRYIGWFRGGVVVFLLKRLTLLAQHILDSTGGSIRWRLVERSIQARKRRQDLCTKEA
jgi:hypothetical protein